MTSLLTPLVEDPDAPLAGRNPSAKLAAALILMGGVVITVDPLTSALVLATELVGIQLAGLSGAALLRRGWPVLITIASLAVTNTLYTSEQSGQALLQLGPVLITTGGIATGLSSALRLLALVLPGLLFAATTDPRDLADSLVQQLRVPARFAYGALAALRLLPLLSLEWRTLSLARRARGVSADRSPVAALRLFFGQTHALLVAAIRRGNRLALAMDARGFGTGPRTSARRQVLRAADWCLIAAAAAVVGLATTASVALGMWELLLS